MKTWHKLGHVYAPSGDRWWEWTHATIPTALVMDDRIRVYYTALDKNKFGRIGFVDVDIDNPRRILHESEEPVLDIGEPGTFDDSGVNASCAIRVNGQVYLYYIGYQRSERVPYAMFAGLAIGDGEKFRKHSRVPILDRTDDELFSRSAPMVIEDFGFRMWYVFNRGWSDGHYNCCILTAESYNGINHWRTYLHPCIEPIAPAHSATRPWVVHDDVYKMWFSVRSVDGYAIGYAESPDGLTWMCLNEPTIVPSPRGWDSESVEYPCVVDAGKHRYMFHCGNGRGESGFGVAEWM